MYGLQEAGRKRTRTNKSPGEWTGTVVETVNVKTTFVGVQKEVGQGQSNHRAYPERFEDTRFFEPYTFGT